ncbi:YraN family protein [Paenibacillus typhae]|uniref:YraN family protein n=1 Tax=Paenibacillus typhae TaxID=1174501 RepID=UPI001C8E17F4|nr:YraN family protein [Paenibacillus typhae]MBY0010120.1 YraN family protein [Paenibacillus typhae]
MRELHAGGAYNRKVKGAAAEAAAALYLASRGYTVVEANWRCRSGELDLVAEYQGALVFIEVRSRSGSPLPGTPEESVDARKIRQVRSTAEVYLHMKGEQERTVSFDVISVQLNPDLSVAALRHIREAF